MDFEYSPKVAQLRRQLLDFMENYVVPNLGLWRSQGGNELAHPECVEQLKELARDEGLWNL